jgi:Histidine phosphatase superfamily (branch 1)
MSRTGPVSLGRTPRSMVASRRRGGADEASSQLNHILHGGALIPSDPVPPPFQLANFGEESLYTLVLLRHGESEWNSSNKYTGWCDVELTKKGEQEARDAGRLLYENGIELDHAFTSVLKRASFSCNMALNTARQHWVPVTKSWRLNER